MALTDKLTAIANAIRSKTDSTNTMTLDEMANEISNISVGSGSSGSGISLDKTVRFMSGDNLVALSTVLDGCSVGKIINPDISNWKDENDNVIDFPFTPTETETVLYGINKTYADI